MMRRGRIQRVTNENLLLVRLRTCGTRRINKRNVFGHQALCFGTYTTNHDQFAACMYFPVKHVVSVRERAEVEPSWSLRRDKECLIIDKRSKYWTMA